MSPDFVEIYDGALDQAFCAAFIERFEASRHRVPGRTGGGVDATKKLSSDLYLNQHAKYQDALAEILRATTRCAEAYFRKYHFALIAPVALTLADPENGQPVALTHENYPRVGAPQADGLMKALYRLGPASSRRCCQASLNTAP